MRIALRTRLTRPLTMLGVVFAASLFAACNSDGAVGPQADISASYARGGKTTSVTTPAAPTSTVTKNGLLWAKELKNPITKSFTVTRLGGGTLEIPELGFSLRVPVAAISTSSLTISVTALAGKVVAYEFEPHGTVFLRPLIVNQELGLTTWDKLNSFKLLGAGYFKDPAQINQTTGLAQLDEIMVALMTPSSVYWGVSHFSGYMVSMD